MSSDGETFSEPVALVHEVGVSQVKLSGSGEEVVWMSWEDKIAKTLRLTSITAPDPSEVVVVEAPGLSSPALAANAKGWLMAGQSPAGVELFSGE
jgi:hypothetical protein